MVEVAIRVVRRGGTKGETKGGQTDAEGGKSGQAQEQGDVDLDACVSGIQTPELLVSQRAIALHGWGVKGKGSSSLSMLRRACELSRLARRGEARGAMSWVAALFASRAKLSQPRPLRCCRRHYTVLVDAQDSPQLSRCWRHGGGHLCKFARGPMHAVRVELRAESRGRAVCLRYIGLARASRLCGLLDLLSAEAAAASWKGSGQMACQGDAAGSRYVVAVVVVVVGGAWWSVAWA